MLPSLWFGNWLVVALAEACAAAIKVGKWRWGRHACSAATLRGSCALMSILLKSVAVDEHGVVWWCGRLLFIISSQPAKFLLSVKRFSGSRSRLSSHTKKNKNLGVCASRCSVQPLSLIRHGPRPIPSFRRDNPHHTQSSHILCCCPAQKRSEVAGCPASRRITHAYFIAATMPAAVTPFSSKTWSPGTEPNESTPSTVGVLVPRG